MGLDDMMKGEDAVVDTLMYLGTVMVAFGLGTRWGTPRAGTSIFVYGAVLFAVYAYWVLRPHRDR